MRVVGPADSNVETIPGAPVPGVPLVPHRTAASDESAVADVLARLDARLRASQDSAELSAALTMTQRTARWRGFIAVLSTVAGIVYATIDLVREQHRDEPVAIEQRVDELEDKVDAIAEDVGAIADALRPAPAPAKD